MGRHDSKQRKLQVEIIENRDDSVEAIVVRKKIRGSDAFNTDTDPFDYVMRKDIDKFYSQTLEVINFSSSGVLNIDFSINNRRELYPYPKIEVWIVQGNSENLAVGVGITKNKIAGEISYLTIDGVFGDGYILLY